MPMPMTPEQKRVKIAECCGWKHCRPEGSGHLRGPSGVHPLNEKFGDAEHAFWVLPDYLNSLDAMAQAEATLTPSQEELYVELLVESIIDNGYLLLDARYYESHLPNSMQIYRCTAAQRADAFLKVKGSL